MKKNFPVYVLISCVLFSACVPESTKSTIIETDAEITFPTVTPVPDIDDSPEQDGVLPDALPKGIEIEFWHPFSGQMANLIEELILEYNADNAWGVKVKEYRHADQRLLIQDFLEIDPEEKGPDLIASPPFFLKVLRENDNSLENIDMYINSQDWGFRDDEERQFLPILWNSDYASGERIGIPAYRTTNLLTINQTWIKELGFTTFPSNAEDFQTIICEAANRYRNDGIPENDGLGGLIYSHDGNSILSWLKAFGGGFPSDEIDTLSFSNEANIAAASFLHDLFFSDCAWIGKQPLPYQYFSNRQGIAYNSTLEEILIQEEVNEINQSLDDWTIIPYPASSGRPVVLMDGLSYGIFKNKDENVPLAAWDFVRWMLRVENQVRMVQASGSFPLSTNAINQLEEFANTHPVWKECLQFIPMAQNSTNSSNWMLVQDILADISGRLIQYTTSKEDIPILLESADDLLVELQTQE